MKGSLKEVFKNQRVLITGHTGFKGSWLCLLLSKLGADVYGYGLTPPTSPSLYEVARVDEHVQSYIGDIKDYGHLSWVIAHVKPTAIIHLAAQALVRQSYANPIETYDTNVMGTVNLLEAARHINSIKAILNVTTDKCYDNKEWYWGYRESDAIGGYDPYSNSKGCSEILTTSFRNSFFNSNKYYEHGVAIATARAGNVIGGGDWAADRLIPDFIKSISINKEIVLRNPTAIRPWQHVLEALSGYLILTGKLITEGPSFGEAWNFGPQESECKDVECVISTICKYWGGKAKFSIDQSVHPHESKFLKLDCSKARARLNWNQRWSLETSLESIANWHKAYINGADMQKICIEQIDQYLGNKTSFKIKYKIHEVSSL